jgi:hypothetical protein
MYVEYMFCVYVYFVFTVLTSCTFTITETILIWVRDGLLPLSSKIKRLQLYGERLTLQIIDA